MELLSSLDNSLQLQTLNFFYVELYLISYSSGNTQKNASSLCHPSLIVNTNTKNKKNMALKKNPKIFKFSIFQNLWGWSGYGKKKLFKDALIHILI